MLADSGIRDIQGSDTWPIRLSVLHANEATPDPRTDAETTQGAFHLGWFESGDPTPIGVVSFYPAPYGRAPQYSWRLTAMAVLPSYQGRGIGTQLLMFGVRRVEATNAQGMWARARLSAVSFYRRFGFMPDGDLLSGRGGVVFQAVLADLPILSPCTLSGPS